MAERTPAIIALGLDAMPVGCRQAGPTTLDRSGRRDAGPHLGRATPRDSGKQEGKLSRLVEAFHAASYLRLDRRCSSALTLVVSVRISPA